MLFDLSKTNVVGSGCSKIAYQIDDENVILCSKQQKNDNIETELKMIQYLHSFHLPTVENIQIVPISHNKSGTSFGLLQKYIKDSFLLKPNSFPHIKLPEHILPTLIETFTILQKHRISIDDLQFIYNDKEIYIIDPSSVYNIDDLTHIGHQKYRNFHNELHIRYINQMRNLKKLIDFNKEEVDSK